MKIGIEAERANIAQKTGVEHYAAKLIENLAKIDSKNQYILYLRTEPQEWILRLPKNFSYKVIPFPLFWTQLRISLEMLLHPVDVLFIPASAAPLIHPRKTVVTIHDLAWKYFPETFTLFMRNYLRFSTYFAALSASTLIAVSENTKKDLLRDYSFLKPEKVVTIHHGFDRSVLEQKEKKPYAFFPEKFILFISTLQPRKNLLGLIKAFDALRAKHVELGLVVVGRQGWKCENELIELKKHADTIIYLDYVTDEERNWLLARAKCLVVPSFYEGFGMQILEAFAAGTPVAVSNVSSLPEVAGRAAVYFDPTNTSEIAGAIERLLIDVNLRQHLMVEGKERLNEFAWEKCAQETLRVMES